MSITKPLKFVPMKIKDCTVVFLANLIVVIVVGHQKSCHFVVMLHCQTIIDCNLLDWFRLPWRLVERNLAGDVVSVLGSMSPPSLVLIVLVASTTKCCINTNWTMSKTNIYYIHVH